jgi:hypothetical protein
VQDETTFLTDVARRLQAIADAKRLQPQIRGALAQLERLQRLVGERGYAAAGVESLLREAAEANARLQQYAEAMAAAERVIRETAYCLPMLTYEGGETDGVGG